MKKVVVAALWLVLASGCTWGTLTDAQTGAPVRGATVTITDSQGKVVSVAANEGGVYIVSERLAEGTATFEIAAPGYTTRVEQHVIAYDDNENGHEIKHFTLQSDGSPTAPPSGSLTLRFAPAPVHGQIGAPSSFTIELAGVQNLKAFSILVDYDESVVDMTAVSAANAAFTLCPGLLPDTGGLESGAYGPYTIEATCGAADNVALPSGNVALARVDFVCLRAGSSPLTFTHIEAVNESFQNLTPGEVQNSSIQCS